MAIKAGQIDATDGLSFCSESKIRTCYAQNKMNPLRGVILGDE
jgi:hypothetical protein